VGAFLARPSFAILLASGLALSVAQSSVLAYLALYARQVLGQSLVGAGGLLAGAQAGGTAARLGWGAASDRIFGGRRRPGLVANALLGAATYLLFALEAPLPGPPALVLAAAAGAGAFGWVGLYLALAAEVGGPRHAGLLTGVAVSVAWSGILVGPPLFGLLLEVSGGYRLPWLALVLTVTAAAVAIHRLPPLVRRG
jgi:MFS family permease